MSKVKYNKTSESFGEFLLNLYCGSGVLIIAVGVAGFLAFMVCGLLSPFSDRISMLIGGELSKLQSAAGSGLLFISILLVLLLIWKIKKTIDRVKQKELRSINNSEKPTQTF